MNEAYNKDQSQHPKLGSTAYINIGDDTVRKVRIVAKRAVERYLSNSFYPPVTEIEFEVEGPAAGEVVVITCKPCEVYATADEAMENKMHRKPKIQYTGSTGPK